MRKQKKKQNIKLELTAEEGVLIRNLIDLGFKTGGLAAARQLLILDKKIVKVGKVYEAQQNGVKQKESK